MEKFSAKKKMEYDEFRANCLDSDDGSSIEDSESGNHSSGSDNNKQHP